MDKCMESPLNQAHYYERRASIHTKNFRFEEAIESHIKAAELLLQSLSLSENKKAQESIRLQQQYHIRQKDILKIKKLQYQAYKEALKVQKEAMLRVLKAKAQPEKVTNQESEGATLQRAIYRTIEEADSLLELLVHRDGPNNLPLQLAQTNNNNNNEQTPGNTSGSKKPKDDNTVIEELRIVNYQLRSLINELMTQLATSEKEVAFLKNRVSELEGRTNQKSGSNQETVAASGNSSYVFSPVEEIASDLSELPALAPLEMPEFNLSMLRKNYQTRED